MLHPWAHPSAGLSFFLHFYLFVRLNQQVTLRDAQPDSAPASLRPGEGRERIRLPSARREGQERPVHPPGGARLPRRAVRSARGRQAGVRERRARGERQPSAGRGEDTRQRREPAARSGGRRHRPAAEENTSWSAWRSLSRRAFRCPSAVMMSPRSATRWCGTTRRRRRCRRGTEESFPFTFPRWRNSGHPWARRRWETGRALADALIQKYRGSFRSKIYLVIIQLLLFV